MSKRAIAWGVVASAIAFWINLLVKGQIPEMWAVLLVVPVVEEIAKYLGIRQTRSLVVPVVFIVSEVIIQMSGNLFLIRDVWMIWLFYIPFSVVVLKHILFYIVIYLCDYKLYGLILAIATHSVWNWYAMKQGTIPLSLIALTITILPILALYKGERLDEIERRMGR